MSRALITPLVLALAVTACLSPVPAPIEPPTPPTPVEVAEASDAPLTHWLDLQAAVSEMSAEQVDTALASMPKTVVADQLFYFGLLHQQSQTYNGWMQARDVFRQLSQDEGLSGQLRQLAGILEAYNQSRINAHQRYAQLQQQIDELEQQKQLLDQKIQAITDLEAAMSTRKEQ
ncbi:hypothetical protein [Kineobactrum salinum]|uniref:Uncharacterized protein n=1 Tax=Kineobactrum salinum TaxID=2708301 RepID=A0A6C0TYF7_9GAMM|nr:hypothetical protein [Kineobactrum salinum]QIB64678.1 hypothetical protein G3T16_03995 [Kineobactrum salinum]